MSKNSRIRNRCCVDNCDTTNLTGNLFRFPKDPERNQQWKKALGMNESNQYHKWDPLEMFNRVRVCRLHFTANSFTLGGRHLLKTAIPTIIPTIIGVTSIADDDDHKNKISNNVVESPLSQIEYWQQKTVQIKQEPVSNPTASSPKSIGVQKKFQLSETTRRKSVSTQRILLEVKKESSISNELTCIENIVKFLEDNYPSEKINFIKKQLYLLDKSSKGTNIETRREMIPNFTQCRPIINSSDMEECLRKPPEWINRVLPLKKRSNYVIQNKIADCHYLEDDIQLGNYIVNKKVPKTLICHDYKGGYHEDAFVPFEGTEEKSFATDGYTFYNWSQIDYFVYFSHYFVTIPPLSWLNAAHKNGVKILGTIITENKDGVKLCDEELFKNSDQMREFTYKIVEIQKLFGFDGWLLNFENPIKNVEILRDFVELLTEGTHENNSENVVIWYDSVTKNGELIWQNELNDLNRCFFDSCDGIFLNYGWNEESLQKSVKLAQFRQTDVFVGVDIFGRNMFGGGLFSTYKAAEIVRKFGLSMALFAPGWTHETISKKSETASVFFEFLYRDDTLWTSLWPFLYTHPINDFFETDFHLGLDFDDYNIYKQKQQLSIILYPEDHSDTETKGIPINNHCKCLQRAYFENRNVFKISTVNIPTKNAIFHRFFHCDIKLNGKIAVYFLTKKMHRRHTTTLELNLILQLNSESMKKINLLSKTKLLPVNISSLMEVNKIEDAQIQFNNTLNKIAKKYKNLLNNAFHKGTLALNIFEFSTTPSTLLEIGGIIRDGPAIYMLDFGIVQLI